MTPFELFLSVLAVVTAGLGVIYVRHIVRTSGRDRPHDPERVARTVQETDHALLERVLDR